MAALKIPEWKKLEREWLQKKTLWIFVPGREGYAPVFNGTLKEAMGEAMRHATYWRSAVSVYHAPKGRSGEMTLVSEIRIPKGSPLRTW